MLKQTLNGILAGILIIIGCSVFLACEVNYVGAVMFAVALLCICYKGYSLFTGKVGYLAESCKKQDISIVLTALLGNLIGTFLFGLMVSYALPNLQEKAFAICSAKLTQTVPVAFIRAIFCGMLMYLAVCLYKEHKTIAGIVFCVPVFILAGFEHSIADMGYFAISGIMSLEAFLFIWVVILGNSLGGVLLPLLGRLTKERAN